MSNILKVFNPPPPHDLTKEETENCLPCQITSSFFLLGSGLYLGSGAIFDKDQQKEQSPTQKTQEQIHEQSKSAKNNSPFSSKTNMVTPLWRTTVRTFGIGLFSLGIYKAGDGWLWNVKGGKNEHE